MAKVHVVDKFVVSYTGVVEFSKLLKVIRKWCKTYGYSPIFEDSYDKKEKKGLKSVKIKWKFDRKVDDYHKYIYKVTLEMKDYREGEVKGKKVEEGELKVTIKADCASDVDGKWGDSPWKLFSRGVVDKFIRSERKSKVEGKLRVEAEDLRDSIKKFLGV